MTPRKARDSREARLKAIADARAAGDEKLARNLAKLDEIIRRQKQRKKRYEKFT